MSRQADTVSSDRNDAGSLAAAVRALYDRLHDDAVIPSSHDD
jgi:hypothetical protein